LLVQLFFLYTSMFILLTEPRLSYSSPGKILFFNFHEDSYVLNARAFSFPGLKPTGTATIFYIAVILAFIAIIWVRRWRMKLQEELGDPPMIFRFVIPTF